MEFRDDSGRQAGPKCYQNGQNHQTQNQIHQCPCTDKRNPLPKPHVTKSPWIRTFGIFPFDRHKAADRKQADRIFCFAPLFRPDRRSHANRKLVYPHSRKLSDCKMPQLMHKNQQSKYQNCRNHLNHNFHRSSILTNSKNVLLLRRSGVTAPP